MHFFRVMKINQLLVLLLFILGTTLVAQEVERVEVNGKIVVDRNEVEGVTIFNHSSQMGTVSDEDGNFSIMVAVNDKIEFGALQFQDFVITITEEIMESKEMTVHLIEEVNKLPEVVILPYGLSGNLDEDVTSVDIDNPDLDALYFGLNNLDKIEFAPDHLTGVRNIAMEDQTLVYGFNPIAIVGSIFSQLFKSNKKDTEVPLQEKQTIMQVYSLEYLQDALDMVEKELVEFIYYVEENQFDLALLRPEKELEFLDHLNQKKKDFLILKYGRN